MYCRYFVATEDRFKDIIVPVTPGISSRHSFVLGTLFGKHCNKTTLSIPEGPSLDIKKKCIMRY
jgi:hypothetical protein